MRTTRDSLSRTGASAAGVAAALAAFLTALPAAVNAAVAPGTAIRNQASMTFDDPATGQSATTQSETIDLTVQSLGRPETWIGFYTNATFAHAAPIWTAGWPLYINSGALACDLNVTTEDHATVTVTSQRTGDVEVFQADETANSSGQFVVDGVSTQEAATHPVIHQNGILEVSVDDKVTATISGCGGGDATATIFFDPEGTVFDSRTNAPIANAVVDLIDVTGAGNGGSAGSLAVVLGPDGTTPYPPTITTDASGRFVFPLVAPSTYRLAVRSPLGYAYPSVLPISALEVDEIHPTGSFGGNFAVDASAGDVAFDVPLDASTDGWLFVQKTASRSVAEVGEFVDYTVLVRNQSPLTLSNILLDDHLPAGFTYQPGTARLAGRSMVDPKGGRGPSLTFALDPIDSGNTLTLTYRVRIGPGAMQGDGRSRARAYITQVVVASNVAEARVKVEGGVFSDEAFIVGKFFADCNQNRVQDADEPGVPEARIYLEDGSFVITDGEGKYSFAGISPSTHVLKVDPTTLPPGTKLETLSNRNAGDPRSVFVDLKNGELHRADLALDGCSGATQLTLEERRRRMDTSAEVEQGVRTAFTADGKPVPLGDARSLPASGIVGQNTTTGNTPVETHLVGVAVPAGVQLPAAAVTPPVALPAPVLTSDAHFIRLKDGDVMPGTQSSVRVQGRAHANLTLTVNGEVIPEDRIGTRQLAKNETIETRDYVGVELKPGENTLTLSQRNVDGTDGTSSIKVIAPGALARIVLESDSLAPADGNTVARLRMRLFDEHDVPVAERTPVTIDASIGDLLMRDLNDAEPGVQLFVEGGSTEVALRAPLEPGESLVQVRSGSVEGGLKVPFKAELRPMLVTGVIEGVLNLRKLDSRALVPARQQDHFEDEIKAFAHTSSDGKRDVGARAAMFLKGKVKGEYLLTLGYDSDKDTRERLFRDIQPDQFYPVYGDSAIKGFDAQSTGRLYVRVDKERSYLLYGDFQTQPGLATARSLSAYNRSQNGLKEHYQNNRLTVNAFASHDSTTQIVDELRANGTSGPYQLRVSNAEINSERVEILTRDRNQPAVILKSEIQNRFSDYEIELFTGRLLFRRPMPSVDKDLNPISIRITYEVDAGGDSFWLGGTDAQFKLTDSIELGGVFTDDRNPLDPAKMSGVNAQLKLAAGTVLSAEAARTDRETTGAGDGQRVELRHESGALQLRAYAGRTDQSFNNPSAYLNNGRSEGGLRGAYRLSDETKLVAEAIHTADVTLDDNRNGVLVGVEQKLLNGMRLDVGARHVRDERDPSLLAPGAEANAETTSVRAKLTAEVPKHPAATVYVEGEQAIDESDKHLAAIGGDYEIANRGRLYVRHEFISSLQGPYELNDTQRQNTTVVGLDADYMRDGHTFNEYRVRDGMSGREAEAAFGMRNRWKVADGLRADTGFERVHAFSEADQNEATAMTSSLEYTRNPLWKGTARLEYRTSPSADSILNTLGIARKLSDSWTLLAKSIVFLTDNKGPATQDRDQSRFQVGVAYRDSETNEWSGLARYEFRREDDLGNALDGVDHSAHIISAHVNYQPGSDVVYTARYAGKAVDDHSNGIESSSITHLVGGRVTWDVTARWDVGVIGSTLFSDGAATRQFGLGGEVGRQVKDNLWLSAGYNVFGFRDDELAGDEYTNRGFYLRLRFKFDENLFSRGGDR